jgi:hypothetical protein
MPPAELAGFLVVFAITMGSNATLFEQIGVILLLPSVLAAMIGTTHLLDYVVTRVASAVYSLTNEQSQQNRKPAVLLSSGSDLWDVELDG